MAESSESSSSSSSSSSEEGDDDDKLDMKMLRKLPSLAAGKKLPMPADAEVSCPADINDFIIPNPDDCSQFFKCSWGTPYLYQCPNGLLFNPDLDVCDWPGNVDCDGSSSSESSESSSSSSSSSSEEGKDDDKLDVKMLRKLPSLAAGKKLPMPADAEVSCPADIN